MIGEKSNNKFNGVDGITCHEFIQAIRQKAFDEEKSDDNRWMAEVASLQFSGPALKWFEALDDTTQEDWKLLKRALLRQYAEPLYEAVIGDPDGKANDQPCELMFKGQDEEEAEIFVQYIRRRAFQEGKLNDDNWTANFAGTHLIGAALHWHSELSQTTKTSWNLLERAILQKFSRNIQVVHVDAKRISIAKWHAVIWACNLRFPASEKEWLVRGRRRRSDMNLVSNWKATWYLVEPGENIPSNAISISPERGNLFTARAWREGGLTVGKYLSAQNQCYIPWYGNELLHRGPFEVLIGDSSAFCWVSPRDDAFEAVEGGFEANNERALLVARVKEGTGWEPGKMFSGENRGYFGWGGKEYDRPIERVQVLAWAV